MPGVRDPDSVFAVETCSVLEWMGVLDTVFVEAGIFVSLLEEIAAVFCSVGGRSSTPPSVKPPGSISQRERKDGEKERMRKRGRKESVAEALFFLRVRGLAWQTCVCSAESEH